MSSIRDQLDSYGKSTGPRAKGFRLSSTIDTSRLSSLGCGGRCCKFSLTGLTMFLVITGIAICAGGGYANNNSDVQVAIGSDFTKWIIAFGVLMVLIGSVGLAGALRESRMFLSIFMCLLGMFFVALLIFGAWALSNIGKEGVILGKAWQTFTSGQKVAIQNAYGCCGANYWSQATDVTQCPQQCQAKNSCAGCFPVMITDMRTMYTAFGVIFVIVAGIMLITLISTFCLSSGIANAAEAKKGGKKRGRG